MNAPTVRFATSDDGARIAYQRFGAGPVAVVVPEILGSLQVEWEFELYRRAWEHLSDHLDLVIYDKRGCGMSDRIEGHIALETLTNDIAAILDAEGITRASLIGMGDGGMEAVAFAAVYPARVERVVLCNPSSGIGDHRGIDTTGDLESIAKARDAFVMNAVDMWGADAEAMTQLLVPSLATDPSIVEWMTRFQRLNMSRDEVIKQLDRLFSRTLGDLPERVTAPTLVTHTVGNRVIPIESGRRIAALVPNAELIEIPGDDHIVWFAPYWRDVVDMHISFITGEGVDTPPTREYSVVLFTDVVKSTQAALRSGDEAWSQLLDSHDRVAERVVSESSGRIVKSTGDGLLVVFSSLSTAIVATAGLVDQLAELGIVVRAGLHAGEIEIRNADISGATVNLAARVMDIAAGGEILVTSAIRDGLLGSRFRFSDAGTHKLKGFDGQWRLYGTSVPGPGAPLS